MRPLIWMVIAGGSFLIGWSGTRWIAQAREQAHVVSVVAPTDVVPRHAAHQASRSAVDVPREHMASLAALAHESPNLSRDHALAAVLLKLEPADFAAGAEEMIALLKTCRETTSPADLAEAWMDRWLDLDRAGALRFLSSSSFLADLPGRDLPNWPLETLAESALGGAIKTLARREPEWTQQVIEKMDPGERREVAIYTLMSEVAKGGVTKAAPFLAALGEGVDRRAALTGYVTGMITTDVRSGFEKVWAEPAGPLREQLLRDVFTRAGEIGLAALNELLERVNDPVARREHLADGLRTVPPEDALPIIQQESEKSAYAGEWSTAMPAWMRAIAVFARGPHARGLADWAISVASDEDRKIFTLVARNWVETDPVAFQRWLSEQAGSLNAADVEALGNPLASLAAGDLSLREWAETLPAGALRERVRFQVALRGGEGDLAYAAAAYQPLAADDVKGTLAGQVARSVSSEACAAAGEWAMELSLSAARVAAIKEITKTWSARDPHAASQWIEKLPVGTERDTAVVAYTSKVVVVDPEGAALWVEQVREPVQRTRTAVNVYQDWSIENPAAARAWFRSLGGLDEDAVPAFLRHLR